MQTTSTLLYESHFVALDVILFSLGVFLVEFLPEPGVHVA
jgi:hypothetical protein